MAEKSTVLTYKGHPLRRKDNLIYYGSMADKYIVMIQVMNSEKDGALDIANKVHLHGLHLADARSGRKVRYHFTKENFTGGYSNEFQEQGGQDDHRRGPDPLYVYRHGVRLHRQRYRHRRFSAYAQ